MTRSQYILSLAEQSQYTPPQKSTSGKKTALVGGAAALGGLALGAHLGHKSGHKSGLQRALDLHKAIYGTHTESIEREIMNRAQYIQALLREDLDDHIQNIKGVLKAGREHAEDIRDKVHAKLTGDKIGMAAHQRSMNRTDAVLRDAEANMHHYKTHEEPHIKKVMDKIETDRIVRDEVHRQDTERKFKAAMDYKVPGHE
jgi:hypothetical protein